MSATITIVLISFLSAIFAVSPIAALLSALNTENAAVGLKDVDVISLTALALRKNKRKGKL